ncbi:MAG TPA: hypothetical protein VEU95_11220 [Micropepsaceae bacterium]|nr:hypothetical protein [Micropepsaceae bacterium]
MADTSSPVMWAPLLMVLVGGALTLAGTWLGPWISERRKERAEIQKRRAEKFHELVAALFEFDHWVNNARRDVAIGGEVPDVVSPFWKVHAISAAYFPEFEAAIQALDSAASKYKLWMTEASQRRLAGQAGRVSEGHKEAYEPYQQSRDGLLKAMKEFAAKEFH